MSVGMWTPNASAIRLTNMWPFNASVLWTLSGHPSEKVLDDINSFSTERFFLYSDRSYSAG